MVHPRIGKVRATVILLTAISAVLAGCHNPNRALADVLNNPLGPDAPTKIRAALDNGADPNTRGEAGGGTTTLMVAAKWGDQDDSALAKDLLARKVDVKARDKWGNTALHYAALPGAKRKVLLEALLDAGADVNAQRSDGQTALMIIAGWGYSDGKEIELLLARGADPNLKTGKGETALFLATAMNHAAAVRLLKKAGAK